MTESTQAEMLDITPTVNLLRSYRGERVDYGLLIGEGVDNAFDAGATRIVISVSLDEIRFEDNGIGITRDRIASIFSPGDHGAMTTTQLGRFGIGIKAQAINAGNVLDVSSISRDGRVAASVNWASLLKIGGRRWSIDAPRWIPYPVGSPTGTTIAISELRRSPPLSTDKIMDELAQRFYPAIAAGQVITFNGRSIECLPEPPLTDIIEGKYVLADGRSATLRAGFLIKPSKLNRVHVAYRHRVIMPQSSLGCGDYSGLTRMFARVQLDGPWRLARFKNDLTDEAERDELDEALHLALLPILKRCSTETFSARIDRMATLINDQVPEEMQPASPRKKEPKDRQGEKRGRSNPVKDDQGDKGGPAKKRRPRDQLLITFDGDSTKDGVGGFTAGRPQRVNLTKEHPYVAQVLEHRDEMLGAQSLYMLAIILYEQGRQEHYPQFQFEPFGLRVAKTFGMQDDISIKEQRRKSE
jgi:Histidine kinase-, DNA gyrase B-, and HSP90-like ATPase